MQEIPGGSVPPDSPSWYAYVHTITSHKSQPLPFLFSASAPGIYITIYHGSLSIVRACIYIPLGCLLPNAWNMGCSGEKVSS